MILIIKEFSNLIRREHIFFYSLKLYVSNWQKKSFSLFRNELIFSFKLSFIYEWPKDYSKGHLTVWMWLGMPGNTQPKVIVLHATFSWWKSPCKNQRNWCFTPRDIDQRILESDWIKTFWHITCEPQFFQIWVVTGKQRTVMPMLRYFNFELLWCHARGFWWITNSSGNRQV